MNDKNYGDIAIIADSLYDFLEKAVVGYDLLSDHILDDRTILYRVWARLTDGMLRHGEWTVDELIQEVRDYADLLDNPDDE